MRRRRLKTVLWVGLAAGAMALVPSAAAQDPTNVVPNPGFEQGGCGDTPILCGWAPGANTSMGQDTTNPHSGSASVSFGCAYPDCDLYDGGMASISTGPASCAPIGPGAHQASFWYQNAGGGLDLRATFFT